MAVILICIAERSQLVDPDKVAWFTIFRIIFECASAYSTIGLSMGTPNGNFSFSGEFGVVSKLIVRFDVCFDPVGSTTDGSGDAARSTSRTAGGDRSVSWQVNCKRVEANEQGDSTAARDDEAGPSKRQR